MIVLIGLLLMIMQQNNEAITESTMVAPIVSEVETITKHEIRYIENWHIIYDYPRADGSPAIMVNRKNYPEATIEEVDKFIKSDMTKDNVYIPNKYECTDFAVDLHNNAENNGFMAGIVHMDLKNNGHAITVFATREGWYFVDNRGNTYKDITDMNMEIKNYRISW